jgi:hypothetical protein
MNWKGVVSSESHLPRPVGMIAICRTGLVGVFQDLQVQDACRRFYTVHVSGG